MPKQDAVSDAEDGRFSIGRISAAVRILVGRMQTNPDEFYEGNHKWDFIYGDRFQKVMTEVEKGLIYETLKQLRREEFDKRVMARLLPKDKDKDKDEDEDEDE